MLIFLKVKESPNFFFILFSIILFFFCLYLYFTNKKLKQRISKLETETKEILERKLVKDSPNDLVSIKNLSIPLEPKEKKTKTNNQTNKKTTKPNYAYKYSYPPTSSKNPNKEKENRPNVTNQSSKPETSPKPYKPTSTKTTSPVTISKPPKSNTKSIDKPNFNIDEFIRKEEKSSSKQKNKKTTHDYLEEISTQMANELNPQTIELTDYEKVQEEQAVISYKELLALKDKGEIQSEEDDDINFIEDLKQFRNNLH